MQRSTPNRAPGLTPRGMPMYSGACDPGQVRHSGKDTPKKPWACHENGSPRHDTASVPARRDGAALIVVIAIMTILLAIGLTFFAVSRIEVRTATNVSNTVRTELLGDAAVAIAVAALNQDLIDNPTATSLDHPWRSIFSGAWAAGKPWTWKNPRTGGLVKDQAIQVDMNDFVFLNVVFSDGTSEPLYQGPRTRSWLFIPRVEINPGDPNELPLILYDEDATLRLSAAAPRGSLTGAGPFTFAPYAGVTHSRDFLQYRIYNFTMDDNLASRDDRYVGPGDLPFVTSSFYGTASYRDGSPATDPRVNFTGGDPDGFNYPIEQVAAFSDVDNNTDGLNDSIWLPLQEDVFFPSDRIDNDLDGLLDETQENGIDDDGDLLTDQIVNLTSVTNDPDEAIEGAPFVYHGLGDFVEGVRSGDGLDNDGNGLIDDPAEDKYFLTSPLPGIEIYVDLDGDGQAYDLVPVFPGDPEYDIDRPQPQTAPLRIRMPDQVYVAGIADPLTAADVDVLDNDYDLLANDYASYAYVGPNIGEIAPFTFNNFTFNQTAGWSLNPPLPGFGGINTKATDPVDREGYTAWYFQQEETWRFLGNWNPADTAAFSRQLKRGFNDLNRDTAIPGAQLTPRGWLTLLINPDFADVLEAAVRVTHSGEPVCNLIGRAAIQIADVAGTVNVNTAGAMSYRPNFDYPNTNGPLQLASNTGISPSEYDLRMVPEYGLPRVARLWGMRTGGGGEAILPVTTQAIAAGWIDPFNPGTFGYDVSLPGYGRIDDNLDALLLGSNGIDDDGDGLIDEGTRLPSPTDPDYPRLAEYVAQLGVLEGTDEPGELQRFNPLRNMIAEATFLANDDPIDEDNDGFANEIGELGDRMLLSRNEVQQAIEVPPPPQGQENVAPRLANILTTHSTDRSVAFIETDDGLKTLRKIDYALATPQQIAESLIIHSGDEGVTRRADASGINPYFGSTEAATFADGLRQAELHLRAPILTGGNYIPLANFWQDTGAQANYSSGGMLFTFAPDGSGNVIPASDNFPPDPILQAMQTATNVVDTRDRDNTRTVLSLSEPQDGSYVPSDQRLSLTRVETRMDQELGIGERNLTLRDSWWAGITGGAAGQRFIKYTTAGNEAIKINELMVRPVRRVEAETARARDLSGLAAQIVANPPATPEEALLLAQQYMNDPGVFPAPSGEDVTSPVPPELDPSPYTGMPQFDLEVDSLALRMSTAGPAINRFTGTTPADSSWELNANVIGTTSGWSAASDEFGVNDGDAPDVIQFKFRFTDGLPQGRYYMTVNFSDPTNPSNITVNGGGQVEYAIKYSTVPLGLLGTEVTDIVQDVFDVMVAAGYGDNLNTNNNETLLDNFESFIWQEVDETLLGLRGSEGTFNPALVSGWAMFPGKPVTPPVFPIDVATALPDLANPLLNNTYYADGIAGVNSSFAGVPLIGAATTFTVEIPPAVDQAATVPRIYELCVAIRVARGFTPSSPIAINFFDFSQEPDHEYIELANTSDETVDLGGWELEVGPPRDSIAAVPDVERPRFQIPEGTFIAPGGMVLLTTSKFDFFQVNPDPLVLDTMVAGLLGTLRPANYIDKNGIGLARGSIFQLGSSPEAAALLNVTVPPFADAFTNFDPSNNPALPGWDPDNADDPYEPTGSVFDRTPYDNLGAVLDEPTGDYVDRSGDGIPWRLSDDDLFSNPDLPSGIAGRWVRDDVRDTNNDGLIAAQEEWLSDRDLVDIEAKVTSSYVPLQIDGATGFLDPDKPWDRIIQLEGPATEDIDTLELLAALVLRGGILPNYPEEDGVDNDGDAAILIADGIDNDRDGYIDEQNSATGNFEGIDEGRISQAFVYTEVNPSVGFVRDLALAVSSLAAYYLNNPTLDARDGLPIFDPTQYQAAFGGAYDALPLFDPRLISGGPSPLDGAELLTDETAPYVTGTNADPPDWKALVQRRWYPGDNVVVTLYEGRALDGRVADRVTYNQLDVENRAIDDVVQYPGGAGLHPGYGTWWPKNQMGLDFYKALERKSPHMAGDRFGTTNRWEATDGNYDDWSESPSVFVSVINMNDYPPTKLRFEERMPSTNPRAVRLWQHAMNGSPLRMNTAQRISENPLITAFDGVPATGDRTQKFNPLGPGAHEYQFETVDVYNFASPIAGDPPRTVTNKDWSHRYAQVRNAPSVSLGDLLRIPQPSYEHFMLNPVQYVTGVPTDFWLQSLTPINYAIQYSEVGVGGFPVLADIALRGVTLGQGNTDSETPNPLNAVADVTTSNPLTLTVGAATVTPGDAVVAAFRSSGIGDNEVGELTTWTTTGSGSNQTIIRGPGVWLPVLSFLLDAETGQRPGDLYGAFGNIPVEDRFVGLFRPESLLKDPFFASVVPDPVDYIQSRQPFSSRAMMYVAQINDQIIDPLAPPDPVTGLQPPVAPRALFEWGPEDGLEGGTYDLYVGTYVPGLVDRLATLLPDALSLAGAPLGVNIDDVLDDRLLNPELLIEELPDPLSRRSRDAGFCVGAECPDYMLRTAVATTRIERSRLLGIGVGGQNFGLLTEVHPRSDGYAYLGTVNIKDDENYLALFVELPTQGIEVPKRLNMLTHVVLAPRDRTPGKVNVNTTEVRARHTDVAFPTDDDQLFTALMGLPGYVPPGVSRDDNSVAAPTALNVGAQAPWTAPAQFNNVPFPPLDNSEFGGSDGNQAAQLSSLTTIGRTEHPEGRYYERITDLALEDSGYTRAQNDAAIPQGTVLYPLSVSQDAEARFADILDRYPAISNLITTRSDVFEIIATVQSGYGLDQDGDGFINYRSNEEFVTTAESKVRTVYERRVPEPGE